MAGKDQHHVWRMLQRGFGDRRGKDHHIFVYRKAEKPKQRGTGNFGVGKYFYGPEGSETDQKITDFENSIQGNILDTRSRPQGYELSADFAASLIAHLEVRSNFLRSEFSNLTERMFSALEDHFASTDKVKTMMKAYLRNHPEKLDQFLAKSLIPINRRKDAAQFFESYLDNLPLETAEQLFGGKLSELFQTLVLIPDTIKNAHNTAILDINNDNPRIRALKEFCYFVFRPPHGQLILPDTCCAFIGPEKVAPFTQRDDDIATVIVPISSQVAIVGRKGHQSSLELKTVNRLLAGCAYEAFIARINDPSLGSLTRRIGKYAKVVSDREIQEIFGFGRMLEL